MDTSYHSQEIRQIDSDIEKLQSEKGGLEKELSHLTYELKGLVDAEEVLEKKERANKEKFGDLKGGAVERGGEERVLDSQKKKIRETKLALENEETSITAEETRLKREMQLLATKKEQFEQKKATLKQLEEKIKVSR